MSQPTATVSATVTATAEKSKHLRNTTKKEGKRAAFFFPPKNRSTYEPAKASLPSVWEPTTIEEAAAAVSVAAATAAAAAAGSTGTAAQTPAASRVTVRYVLRAEDVGTGREWVVFPRYSDFRCVPCPQGGMKLYIFISM